MTEFIYLLTTPEKACMFLQMCDGDMQLDKVLNLGNEEVKYQTLKISAKTPNVLQWLLIVLLLAHAQRYPQSYI